MYIGAIAVMLIQLPYVFLSNKAIIWNMLT